MIRHLIYIVILFVVFSCGNSVVQTPVEAVQSKDEMVDVNKYLVEKDNESIKNFIESKNLTMQQTQSGLWYTIIKEGTGDFFTDESLVTFEYISSLLDGTPCYSTTESGPIDCVIGKSNIESGLNEGLKLLKPGSEAMFIIPPYLAFGLLGDGNLIPARAIIVYSVRVINRNQILE